MHSRPPLVCLWFLHGHTRGSSALTIDPSCRDCQTARSQPTKALWSPVTNGSRSSSESEELAARQSRVFHVFLSSFHDVNLILMKILTFWRDIDSQKRVVLPFQACYFLFQLVFLYTLYSLCLIQIICNVIELPSLQTALFFPFSLQCVAMLQFSMLH